MELLILTNSLLLIEKSLKIESYNRQIALLPREELK